MKIEILFRNLKRSMGLGPPRPSAFVAPAIGLLAVGIVAGAAMVMLLAPTSAREVREGMGSKLSGVKQRLLTSAEKADAATRANAHIHRS